MNSPKLLIIMVLRFLPYIKPFYYWPIKSANNTLRIIRTKEKCTRVTYQPLLANNSSLGKVSILMPTIASPRFLETLASSSGLL